MRETFQGGSLVKRKTKSGFSWVVRFRDTEGKQRAKRLGTHIDLPSETHAQIELARHIAAINSNVKAYTFAQLIEKYKSSDQMIREQTKASYNSQLKYIEDKYGDLSIQKVLGNIMEISEWLSNLKCYPTRLKGPLPLSKKSKQHIKAMMHRLVECAMMWGYIPVGENPVARAEIKYRGLQPKKRLKVPLTIAQFHALLRDPELCQHVKVMIALAMGLGLRISEILALKWDDIDFENGKIAIEKSIVGKHLEATKTDASEATMPMHPQLAIILEAWKQASPVVNGWVFGSEATGRPFHRDSLQSDHLAPAGKRIGIIGLGWHTFRHTYRKLMKVHGVQDEVQMLLMRHADLKTTRSYGNDDGDLELKRIGNEVIVANIFGLTTGA